MPLKALRLSTGQCFPPARRGSPPRRHIGLARLSPPVALCVDPSFKAKIELMYNQVRNSPYLFAMVRDRTNASTRFLGERDALSELRNRQCRGLALLPSVRNSA